MHCCWTCGETSGTVKELFEHMRTSHELGVDFIECPVCGDLVVNMVIHFGRSHQGMALPHGTQLQITGVAKDFRALKAMDERRQTKRKYKQGFFDSVKNGKPLHYRSGWELDCYKILENSFAVAKYLVEPFPVPYMFAGSLRNYWPDILILFVDDQPAKPSRALIEVKPLDQCPSKEGKAETYDQARNDAKWQAADAFCQSRGFEFVVWTERSIVSLGRMRKEALTKNVMIGSEDPAART